MAKTFSSPSSLIWINSNPSSPQWAPPSSQFWFVRALCHCGPCKRSKIFSAFWAKICKATYPIKAHIPLLSCDWLSCDKDDCRADNSSATHELLLPAAPAPWHWATHELMDVCPKCGKVSLLCLDRLRTFKRRNKRLFALVFSFRRRASSPHSPAFIFHAVSISTQMPILYLHSSVTSLSVHCRWAPVLFNQNFLTKIN